MIALFTDFGSNDIYVGQMHAAIRRIVPDIPVIDLMHDAPAFNCKASAYLLAALLHSLPEDCTVCGVVDPGVGGARRPLMIKADKRWLVGPDNGLLTVAAARAEQVLVSEIMYRPESMSASFHGRDLFAPVAAKLAAGRMEAGREVKNRVGAHWPDEFAEVIHVDHYGNLLSGLRGDGQGSDGIVVTGGREIMHASYFSEQSRGKLFWYRNSIGLIEVAANLCSASELLGVGVGDNVALKIGSGD